ncbi:MAG: GntR family transcriptional regulator [Anaerolineales bacterium]|nr:GntR family transcriptional regulator [Anaerolineales bacterium]
MPSHLTPINTQPQTLSDRVYDAICNAIVEGELAPGQRLREAEVAESLGVSRTPVREAFARLGQQNLVDKGPTGWYSVARWDRQTLWEVATLRTSLEELAISLACQNLTIEDFEILNSLIADVGEAIEKKDYEKLIAIDINFHSFIWSRSQHKLLEAMLEQMRPQIRYFMYLARPADQHYTTESHLKLVEVLKEKDLEAVKSTLRDHILTAAERTIAQLNL